ncbi:MAG: lysine-sensitive aspartokinase 3 [Balneolales bacterium]
MKVLKFGGTSMADEGTWSKILSIISNSPGSLIVVSAISKATNTLLEAISMAQTGRFDEAVNLSKLLKERHERIIQNFFINHKQQDKVKIINEAQQWIDENFTLLDEYLLSINKLGEVNKRTIDVISSIGERLSSCLLAACGRAIGIDTVYLDARTVIHTDDNFGKAKPDHKKIKQESAFLNTLLVEGKTPIMGGFYGSSPTGEITTLGRGGSDYSASLIAGALDAGSIEIWTDVNGMYSCDPRYVAEAKLIPEIGFEEAAELAYFGARVLHPATIQPAVEKNIPVYIKNTFSPEQEGTKICSNSSFDGDIRAIAFKQGITIVTINSSRMLMAYGFLARVFSTFEKYKVPVDLVTTSEVSISMTVDSTDNLDLVLDELQEYGDVDRNNNQSLICLVGRNFNQSSGIAVKVFDAISGIPVRMISQGSSDINLSLVVDNDLVIKAVQALHEKFFY